MTALLERLPLERVSDRAHAARPARTLLVVVLAVLFGTGWAAYKTLAAAWLALAWTGAAVAEGWISARTDAKMKRVRRGAARTG